MNSYYKTNGIVLASRNVGEYDRVITCFTKEYGRVELLAKAVRKITSKLRSGLEPFCLSWLEFVEGKHGYIVTEAIAVKKFSKKDGFLHEELHPIFEVRDFFLNIIQGQERDEGLFDCLVGFFDGCEEKIKHKAELGPWADQTKGTLAMLCGYGYGLDENIKTPVDS